MQEMVHTMGMILRAEPIGEYDRRIVILTKDYGKISAFARGARRQSNRLQGRPDLFCFGEFKLYPGKNSYTLVDATIKNYFEELRNNFNAALYGMYFLEIMEYLTRENNDEKEMLKLLYQASRELVHDAYDNRLVRAVFELKTMVLSGEYQREDGAKYKDTTLYTVDYIIGQKVEGVFNFTLSEEILKELQIICENGKKRLWNHSFKSEEMLKMVEM